MSDELRTRDERAAAERARRRREWWVVAAIVGAVFLVLALLTYSTDRAADDGVIAGLAWRYLQGLLLLMVVFSVFTLGLNLEFGYTGLINFGHVAFYSIGAYAAAVAAWRIGPALENAGFLEAVGYMLLILLGATTVSVGLALLLGGPTLKLREDYLAIVTIGAAEIVRTVWINEEALTNGPQGLPVRMPGVAWILDPQSWWNQFFRWLRESPLAINLDPYFGFVLLVAALALTGSYALIEFLVQSPWGRVLKAIREDEDVASSLGKNVFVYKMQALILGSVIAAVAGILLAWFQRFITPFHFVPLITFYAWIAMVVGGVGNNKGALAGSALLWGVFEIARNLEILGVIGIRVSAGPIQVVAIGVFLILIMMFRPQGAMGRREEMMFGR